MATIVQGGRGKTLASMKRLEPDGSDQRVAKEPKRKRGVSEKTPEADSCAQTQQGTMPYRVLVCRHADGGDALVQNWVAGVYAQLGLNMDTPAATAAAAEESHSKLIFLGFDVEWCAPWWRNPGEAERVETIQLYSPGMAGALVYSIGGGVRGGSGYENALPPALVTLLGDCRVVKLGVNVQGDASRVCRDCRIPVRSTVDIATDSAHGSSLEELANSLLPPALHISKTKEHGGQVQVSNWAAWPLTEPQIAYAAKDALLSYWIFAYTHQQKWEQEADGSAHKPLVFPGGWLTSRGTDSEPTPVLDGTDQKQKGLLGGGRSCSLASQCSTPRMNRQDSSNESGGKAELERAEQQQKQQKHSNFFVMRRNASIAPPTRGVKDIPRDGSATALAGVVAVISGVLDSMTREEMKEYIVQHGGRVTATVAKSVTVLLNDHGEVGPSKRVKCEQFGIPIESEDFILQKVAASRLQA